MANLNVQPKRQTPWWLWLLLILVGAAILYFILHNDRKTSESALITRDTSVIAAATEPNWDRVDFNAPGVAYSELADTDIVVSAKDNYSIYSLGENIIFNTDDSSLQANADSKLSQIAASLNKRFKGAKIGVYGGTDATGSAYHNSKLGERRAETVKNWLVKKGDISAGNISVHTLGEGQPVADNSTAKGRKQNRNVQIVVFKNSK